MNEKVSISDINIHNNFKDIKTNYSISLYDKDTGELVSNTEGHNRLNPNWTLNYWHSIYGMMLESFTYQVATDNMNELGSTGIFFYNSQDEPSSNALGGPHTGIFVGSGRLTYADSHAQRCSYNPTESYYEITFEEGTAYKHAHMVYDATTAQLNGEINTIVLGSSRLQSYNALSANYYMRSNIHFTGTVYEYMRPLHGQTSSLISFHPDRPAWLTPKANDYDLLGTWSFEADNTAWFCPQRSINAVDDMVLFHFNFMTWEVIETIKLSVPEECKGKTYYAYKFNNSVMMTPTANGSYYENSDGTAAMGSSKTYIFNLNGDFVKSIGKSFIMLYPQYALVVDNYLYYFPCRSNTSYYSMLKFDSELTFVEGVRMKDYMDDPQFYSHSSYGKPANSIRPVYILDKYTGERRILFNGYNTSSSYVMMNNLTWNLKTQEVEWLDSSSIYRHLYDWPYSSSLYTVVVVNQIPMILPTASGTGLMYLPRPWTNWCKLPTPVTKTANTTMKIQIDVFCPVVSPFKFAVGPDESSATEVSE